MGGKSGSEARHDAAEAMAAGATYLVVGRPITGAEDRNAAAKRLAEELAA